MPDAKRDTGPATTDSTVPTGFTRLNLNLNPEAAAALKEYVEKRHISYTEAVRRAIALLKFVDDQISAGREFQVTDGQSVQKIVLVS